MNLRRRQGTNKHNERGEGAAGVVLVSTLEVFLCIALFFFCLYDLQITFTYANTHFCVVQKSWAYSTYASLHLQDNKGMKIGWTGDHAVHYQTFTVLFS